MTWGDPPELRRGSRCYAFVCDINLSPNLSRSIMTHRTQVSDSAEPPLPSSCVSLLQVLMVSRERMILWLLLEQTGT